MSYEAESYHDRSIGAEHERSTMKHIAELWVYGIAALGMIDSGQVFCQGDPLKNSGRSTE